MGAFLVNGAKSFFTVTFPEYWLFFLGLLFVLVTMFLPQGIYGVLAGRWRPARPVDETAGPAAATTAGTVAAPAPTATSASAARDALEPGATAPPRIVVDDGLAPEGGR